MGSVAGHERVPRNPSVSLLSSRIPYRKTSATSSTQGMLFVSRRLSGLLSNHLTFLATLASLPRSRMTMFTAGPLSIGLRNDVAPPQKSGSRSAVAVPDQRTLSDAYDCQQISINHIPMYWDSGPRRKCSEGCESKPHDSPKPLRSSCATACDMAMTQGGSGRLVIASSPVQCVPHGILFS